MKRRNPQWIKHTHVFNPDDYECSICGEHFCNPSPKCPSCGAPLMETYDPQDWVDEMEELDMILGDD